MKLLMAVSNDAFIATGADDDMSWTGPTDKKLFRILTSVGGVCAAGRRTIEQMPSQLIGRSLLTLTRNPEKANERSLATCEADWLLGGQTVALRAKELGLLKGVHLIKVLSRNLKSGVGFDGRLTQGLAFINRVPFEDVEVWSWRVS